MSENTKTVFFPNDAIIKLIPFCRVKLQTDLYLSTGDLVESKILRGNFKFASI